MAEEILNTSPIENTSPSIEPPKKDTFVAKPQATGLGKAYESDLYYNTGYGKSKYDQGLHFESEVDKSDVAGSINEWRAKQQSGLLQLGAGVARAGVKAAAEVAKLPGIIGGIVASPLAEEGQGYDTAFNNSWIKGIDKINEEINTELLPVYVQKAVKDGNLWDNITSTAFWATEGADGLGFMLGMMAPGAIINKLGVGAKLLGAGKNAAQMLGIAGRTEQAVSALKGMGMTAKSIDVGMGAIVNTISESGAEAAGVGNDMDSRKNEFISQQTLPKMQELDELRLSGLINMEEYTQRSEKIAADAEASFKDQRALAMRDVFKANLGVLIIPNLLMSKALFGTAEGALVKQAEKTGVKGAAQRIGKAAGRWGEAFASEGFLEEASQSTAQKMFTDKAMKGELSRDKGFLKDFSIGEATDAYLDMVSSNEGQKAIFLGGIMGAPMMSYTGRKEDVVGYKAYEQYKTDKNSILEGLHKNTNNFNTIFTNDIYVKNEAGYFSYERDSAGRFTSKRKIDPVKVMEVAKALNYKEEQSKELEEAITNGDQETVDRIKKEALFELITPAIHNGEAGIDALEEKLKEYNKTSEIEAKRNTQKGDMTSADLVKETMKTAKWLQEQNEKFQDFGNDVIRFRDPSITPEIKTAFLNQLNQQYLNVKYNLRNDEQKLKSLEEKRKSILDEFDEGRTEVGEESKTGVSNTSPLLMDVQKEIDAVTTSINKGKKDIAEIWSDKGNEKVNRELGKFKKQKETEATAFSSEVSGHTNQSILNIRNAQSRGELDYQTLLPIQKPLKKEGPLTLGEEEARLEDEHRNEQLRKIKEISNSVRADQSFENLEKAIEEIDQLDHTSPEVLAILKMIKYNLDPTTDQELLKKLRSVIKKHSNLILNNQVVLNEVIKRQTELEAQEQSEKEAEEARKAQEFADKQNEEGPTDGTEETPIPEVPLGEEGSETDSTQNPTDPELEDDAETPKDTSPKDEEDKGDTEALIGGAKLISTRRYSKAEREDPTNFPPEKAGEVLFTELEDFVDYERTPRDKTKDHVEFDEGDYGFGKKGDDALDLLRKLRNTGSLDTKEIEFLEKYLPIRVDLSETKDAQWTSSFLETMGNPNTEYIVEKETLPLRQSIIKTLIANNGDFNGIQGSVKKQFPGQLKVEPREKGDPVQKNRILDLEVFNGMSEDQKREYFKRNTAYVKMNGDLVSTLDVNKIYKQGFKHQGAGEVYLFIPRANGTRYPLKLNVNTISDAQADDLYNLMLLKFQAEGEEISLRKVLGKIKTPSLRKEFELIVDENKLDLEESNNATLTTLINLLIFNGNVNPHTRFGMYFNNKTILGKEGLYSGKTGVKVGMLFSKLAGEPQEGGTTISKEDLLANAEDYRKTFKEFFRYKRHNVIIKNPHVNFEKDSYIDYLLDKENPVLTTNAVVGEGVHQFQGYANIYLNHEVKNTAKPADVPPTVEVFGKPQNEKPDVPVPAAIPQQQGDGGAPSIENQVANLRAKIASTTLPMIKKMLETQLAALEKEHGIIPVVVAPTVIEKEVAEGNITQEYLLDLAENNTDKYIKIYHALDNAGYVVDGEIDFEYLKQEPILISAIEKECN